MSNPTESRPFRELLRASILTILFLGSGLPQVTPKQSERGSPPKYDLKTEAKFKGLVDEVKQLKVGSKEEITELMLKSGTETIEIYLCPKSFVEEMGLSFAKGDEIQVTGSKLKQGGTDLILAREVVKGNDTLVLRDPKGNPVWNWQRRN